MDALQKIQQELKAPKGQFNKFGGYHYRSAEDILEAVKPLLEKHKAQLTLSDEIVEVGGRVYVRARAEFTDGKEAVAVTAYAREPQDKKGMDASQITGTASSYARKYALNGLFLIDDTKDADTDEFQQQTTQQRQPPPQQQQPIGQAGAKIIYEMIQATGSNARDICEYFHVRAIEEMTPQQATQCKAILKKKQEQPQ